MKDHRWISVGKPCTAFRCKACEKEVPNTPEGRAYAWKAQSCRGISDAAYLAKHEAEDAANDLADFEIARYRELVAGGMDKKEAADTISDQSIHILNQRNRSKRARGTLDLLMAISPEGAMPPRRMF